MSNDEMEIFYLINEERKKRGLDVLKKDERLGESARKRSQDSSSGMGFTGIIRTLTGAAYTRLGELMGSGYDNDKIAKSFVEYSNQTDYIFYPLYTHIGVGIAPVSRLKKCTIHLGRSKDI